jgi:hypothetical protein
MSGGVGGRAPRGALLPDLGSFHTRLPAIHKEAGKEDPPPYCAFDRTSTGGLAANRTRCPRLR